MCRTKELYRTKSPKEYTLIFSTQSLQIRWEKIGIEGDGNNLNVISIEHIIYNRSYRGSPKLIYVARLRCTALVATKLL